MTHGADPFGSPAGIEDSPPAAAGGSAAIDQQALWIKGWIADLFEDVVLVDPQTARSSSLRTLALICVSHKYCISWFSTPLGWSEWQELSLAGLFPFQPKALLQQSQGPGDPDLVMHHLALGPSARLRHFGVPLQPGTALGGRVTSGKTITAVVPRLGVGMILKHSAMVANLRREVEALKQCPEGLLTPRHLGQVAARDSSLITAQTLLPGQSLEWLGPLTEERHQAVVDALRQLVHTDRTTTLLEQARSLASELASARLPADQRQSLERLLGGITDQQQWHASRLHGDLRPLNLQVCPLEREGDAWRCGLGFLDWEFSRPCGLGVTDYLRLHLDRGYVESRSFAELLQPCRLEQLQQGLSRLDLPGAAGPLDQLLRLHVVMHALDRLVSFGNATGIRMTNLRSMLTTPWPL